MLQRNDVRGECSDALPMMGQAFGEIPIPSASGRRWRGPKPRPELQMMAHRMTSTTRSSNSSGKRGGCD